jgi:hypothetical protein
MNTVSETTLTFSFSREELAYLVQQAGASKILGLSGTAQTILYPDKGNAVYATVERALLARGVLAVSETRQLVVAPLVLNLVKLCVRPAYTVTIVQKGMAENQSSYRIFHVLPRVLVIHRQQLSGVHELRAITGKPFDLAATMAVLLPPVAPAFSISLQVASFLETTPVLQEFSIVGVGNLWMLGRGDSADNGPMPDERPVTREELIAFLDEIGEPIRALSQLQIEPQL